MAELQETSECEKQTEDSNSADEVPPVQESSDTVPPVDKEQGEKLISGDAEEDVSEIQPENESTEEHEALNIKDLRDHSRPLRFSRLLNSDKPPEDPKFSFLSDPERDGKTEETKGNKEEKSATSSTDTGNRKNNHRWKNRGGTRIPTAEPDLREKLNRRRAQENPEGNLDRSQQFYRNDRYRSSYPAPRRYQNNNGEDADRWGHSKYFELYGEPSAQKNRRGGGRGGRGNYRMNEGRQPNDNSPRSKDKNTADNHEPDASNNEQRTRRNNNQQESCGEQSGSTPIRQSSQGNRGNFRGSFRGRGSFRKKNLNDNKNTTSKDDDKQTTITEQKSTKLPGPTTPSKQDTVVG